MSALIPRCDRCDLDREFIRIAPIPNQTTYGVEWRCPKCDDHSLELCPLGPLVPTDQTCLNCGAARGNDAVHAECPVCGMTRQGAIDFFHLDPIADNPVESAGKLFDQGLIRRAVATLNYALLWDPSLELAWRTKYSFLSGLGFTEAACTVIEAAISHVVNPELLISYGHVLQSLKRHPEAIDAYHEYLLTAPDGEYAATAMCEMAKSTYHLKDSVAAEVLYRRAIDKGPTQATCYAGYVQLLLDEKRFDAALPLIEKALACDPEPELAARLLEDKALVLAEQTRGNESLEAIDAAIRRDAVGIRAYYLRGRALAMVGRLKDARQCMQHVLRLDPDNPEAQRARKLLDKALR